MQRPELDRGLSIVNSFLQGDAGSKDRAAKVVAECGEIIVTSFQIQTLKSAWARP